MKDRLTLDTVFHVPSHPRRFEVEAELAAALKRERLIRAALERVIGEYDHYVKSQRTAMPDTEPIKSAREALKVE